MYDVSGDATVANCTFIGNSAESGGGMSNFDSSAPTVPHCKFIGNVVAGLRVVRSLAATDLSI